MPIDSILDSDAKTLSVPAPSRLISTGWIYHQRTGQEPQGWSFGWSLPLDNDEQPYFRELTVGEEWRPLDHGWLDSASRVCFWNRGESVLEVACDGSPPFAKIDPGSSTSFSPTDVTALRVRARQDQTRFDLLLIPE